MSLLELPPFLCHGSCKCDIWRLATGFHLNCLSHLHTCQPHLNVSISTSKIVNPEQLNEVSIYCNVVWSIHNLLHVFFSKVCSDGFASICCSSCLVRVVSTNRILAVSTDKMLQYWLLVRTEYPSFSTIIHCQGLFVHCTNMVVYKCCCNRIVSVYCNRNSCVVIMIEKPRNDAIFRMKSLTWWSHRILITLRCKTWWTGRLNHTPYMHTFACTHTHMCVHTHTCTHQGCIWGRGEGPAPAPSPLFPSHIFCMQPFTCKSP